MKRKFVGRITMKKIMSIFLTLVMLLGVNACVNPICDPEQLAKPSDLNMSATGLISWSYVEHATSYEITVDGVTAVVNTTYYQLTVIPNHDFTYSVIAKADGYPDSEAAVMSYTAPKVAMSIKGADTVLAGKAAQYTAQLAGETGSTEMSVTWSVEYGKQYAEITQDGTLITKDISGSNQSIIIRATSIANSTQYAEKTIMIQAWTKLTQAMLDELSQADKIEFTSEIDIDIYTAGARPEYVGQSQLDTNTKMDGTNWYSQYQLNDGLGTIRDLFYTNHDGVASTVSVSFMNEEIYEPMVDKNGKQIDWFESGLYNVFKGTEDKPQNLTLADFNFNEENYRWEYVGKDNTFISRAVSSANPYDFEPKNLWLIIEEDEIKGFMSESEVDRQVSQGNDSYMTITAHINIDDVEVPKIGKFEYNPEIHAPLKNALENMHKLSSYTMIFRKIESNMLTGNSLDLSGYKETITEDTCFYEDFKWDYEIDPQNRNEITYQYDYTGYKYGYKQVEDNLYNLFQSEPSKDSPGQTRYKATRAYSGNVKEARPGYNFAAEIFTRYAKPNEGDDFDMYYEVADQMLMVATEFYKFVDVLDQLYGLYTYIGNTGSDYIYPSLTVKDGYITEASFYYYLGYMSGVIEIEFSDFNSATIGETIEFEKREVPTSWDGVLFNELVDEQDEAYGKTFEEYTHEFLNTQAEIPFFGAALGDCYTFSMPTMYKSLDDGKLHEVISVWYDVPLDLDYTLSSSIKKLTDWLEKNGFTKIGVRESDGVSYEYKNADYHVAVVESDQLLYVYLWVELPPVD